MKSQTSTLIRSTLGTTVGAVIMVGCLGATADEVRSRQQYHEPVYRVANTASENPSTKADQQHPLDPALAIARNALVNIQRSVVDYECILVKRERIGEDLMDYEYMQAKIRNRKVKNGQITTPFSVYMKFLKPSNVKGREVIYVEGRNGGKLVGHETGVKRWLGPVWLAPDGFIAMRGNRYPITEVGIENLVARLIEKGTRDRKRGECTVKLEDNFKINGRACSKLTVQHPTRREYFDFHIAEVFIDKQLQVPVRYAAYTWPKTAGGKPQLLEEYTYLNLKMNVGLKDSDFDHLNPNYQFK